MLDTFKAQLKAKAKTLGVTNLSNKRIDAYAATLEKQNPNLATDDDHAEKVDAFLEFIDIKEIASYDDYKASKGATKGGKQEPAKADPNKSDPEKDVTDPVVENDPNVPAWAKQLIDSNKALNETVAKLQQEKNVQSFRSKLKESLKDVPETFYDEWALPEKEEDLEAFETKVKTKWEAFNKENQTQQQGTATTGYQPKRSAADAGTKVTDSDVKDILSQM